MVDNDSVLGCQSEQKEKIGVKIIKRKKEKIGKTRNRR
jgi:hypothetical protein